METNRTAEEILAQCDRIPPLSDTVMQVLRELDSPQVELHRLEPLINREPALAARILKMANSSFYGVSGKVYSIANACLVLGLPAVRNLVLAVGVLDRLPADRVHGIDGVALWRHCLAVGGAAAELAPRVGVDAGLAFSAGMLHDIGKLVLAIHIPDLMAPVLGYRDQHQCSLREAEDAVLGMNHAQIGALVANHWRLPPELLQVVVGHHDPGAIAGSVLVALVHLADVLVRGLDVGDPGDRLIPALDENVFIVTGVDWDAVEHGLPGIERAVEGATQLTV